MDPVPVTKDQEFTKLLIDEQRETNSLLRKLLPPAAATEILTEPARHQLQHKGKR